MPLYADSIDIVTLSLSADTPNAGIQEIAITNQSGPVNGCNAIYAACDTLAIESWTLTVDYTSSYYNGSGPTLASPYIVQWSDSTDDILPAAVKAFDLDLCGSSDVPDCSEQTTAITEIDFTGSLDRANFTIYDPNANNGNGGPGPAFFANPAFSLTLLPSAGFPSDYFESLDGFVGDQLSAAPEPGTMLLFAGGLVVLSRLRRV
jgi:hypothetical protein